VSCQDAGLAGDGSVSPPSLFFVTRQRGEAPTACSPTDTIGVDNLHGCGNFGMPEATACNPSLDWQLSHTDCASHSPWSCNDPNSMTDEAQFVVKPGSAGGGVLCCR